MPRPVSMRASYGADASYLLRLQAAVKKDDRRTAEWTQKVLQCLNQVSTLFLQAEAEDLGKAGDNPRKSKRKEATSASLL
jgi:hypothetical protein